MLRTKRIAKKRGNKRQNNRIADEHITRFRSFHRGEKCSSNTEISGDTNQGGARPGVPFPQTPKCNEGKHKAKNIEQEKSGRDELIAAVIFPVLVERKNVADKRQELDARGEPDGKRALEWDPEAGAERMARSALFRDLAKSSVLFLREVEALVVLLDKSCYLRFFRF